DDYQDFRRTLKSLVDQGHVTVGVGGTVDRPASRPVSGRSGGRSAGGIVGVFRANRRGFGFVIPKPPGDSHRKREEQIDVVIPPGASLDAQTGDTVVWRVTRRRRRDGKPAWSGWILEILAP